MTFSRDVSSVWATLVFVSTMETAARAACALRAGRAGASVYPRAAAASIISQDEFHAAQLGEVAEKVRPGHCLIN